MTLIFDMRYSACSFFFLALAFALLTLPSTFAALKPVTRDPSLHKRITYQKPSPRKLLIPSNEPSSTTTSPSRRDVTLPQAGGRTHYRVIRRSELTKRVAAAAPAISPTTPKSYLGQIEVQDPGGDLLGYLSQDGLRPKIINHFETSDLAGLWSFDADQNLVSTDIVMTFQARGGDPTTASLGYIDRGNGAVDGADYLQLIQGTDATDTGYSALQTNVWTLDPQTGSLTVTYRNTPVFPVLYKGGSQIFLSPNPAAFSVAYGSSPVLTFRFVMTGGPRGASSSCRYRAHCSTAW